MYNKEIIEQLVEFISSKNGITDKRRLASQVQGAFNLIQDKNVYYCDWFAVRFCQSKYSSSTFSGIVLSLSRLQKFDTLPFIVCLVTPTKNYLFIANSTHLNKISHSSQQLRIDNIRGSFLGSNIIRTYEGIEALP